MRKVTVGFKCHPELKQRIITQAQSGGVTVSEFLENLCENVEYREAYLREQYEQRIDSLEEELSELRTILSEYEVELLGPLFNKYEGQQLSGENGNPITVATPQDILKALLTALENQYG